MADERITSEPVRVPAMKRASWGAIIAGVVIILMIQMILWTLGLAIGLAAADPGDGNWQGLGIGAIIWLVLSTLIALFVGGWATGRLAGVPRRIDGALHGLVAWGVANILALYLVSSAVGAMFGGAASLLQFGVQQAPTERAAQQMPMTRQQVILEARSLVEDRPAEGLSEEQRARAQQQLESNINQMLPEGEGEVDQQQQQEVVSTLVQATELSEDEARQKVNEWIDRYEMTQQVRTSVREVAGEASERAPEALDISAQAALWSFLSLLLGGAASALGGMLGAPKDITTTRGNW